MKRVLGLALVVPALAAGLLSAGVSPAVSATPTVVRAAAAPVPVRGTLFGMHPINGTVTVPAGSWRLWDSGVAWPALNPAPGTYNWAPLKAMIDAGHARGVNDFVMVMGITPSWATKDTSHVLPWDHTSTSSPPDDLNSYYTFVKALAEYNRDSLGGAINGFQVWNEMNLSTFWTGTPAQMATMTGRVDTIIKSVDATYPSRHVSRTVAPSVTLRRGMLPTTSTACAKVSQRDACFFGRYLSALASVKGYGSRAWPIDAFAMHTYPYRDQGPAERAALITSMRARLAERRVPVRELWDTEVNYGLRGVNVTACGSATPCVRHIDGNTAAQYVARTYLDSVRLGVSRVYWYAWVGSSDVLGITMQTGSSSATGYAAVRSWISGASFTGCVTVSGVYNCGFTKSGKAFRVLWSNAGTHRVPVKPSSKLCPLGTVCTLSSTAATATVRVGQTPIRVG